jgi:hypothetical protein
MQQQTRCPDPLPNPLIALRLSSLRSNLFIPLYTLSLRHPIVQGARALEVHRRLAFTIKGLGL